MRLLLSILLAIPLSAAAVDGAKVHWTSSGKGQAVILVHGWTCDESSWDAQVPVLSQKYRVITLDLPGHGKSDPPKDGKFSMAGFARAVEAVQAEAKVDKAVLGIYAGATPMANRENLKKVFPNAEYMQVAGTGHFVMMERPEEFNRLLMAFLGKVKY